MPKNLTPERRKLWKALEATSKAFADVPVEELERDVARLIEEDRQEQRALRERKASPAPRS
jgi:hypothetical protein